MKSTPLINCLRIRPLVLTQGAIGYRLKREFGFLPDPDLHYAGLIYSNEGKRALEKIYRSYLSVAEDYRLPILLMTDTRRANHQRLRASYYYGLNLMEDYTQFLRTLSQEYDCTAYIGGTMGCKGAKNSGRGLPAKEAEEFHAWQLGQFDTEMLDFFLASAIPYLPEAVGMARLFQATGKPYIVSFMVNWTGCLLDGTSIDKAIKAIDEETGTGPLCYMSDSIHPDILQEALLNPANNTERVQKRFLGLQANAACFDPQQLADAPRPSNARQLCASFSRLRGLFPLRILGGCYGTDDRHIRKIAESFG